MSVRTETNPKAVTIRLWVMRGDELAFKTTGSPLQQYSKCLLKIPGGLLGVCRQQNSYAIAQYALKTWEWMTKREIVRKKERMYKNIVWHKYLKGMTVGGTRKKERATYLRKAVDKELNYQQAAKPFEVCWRKFLASNACRFLVRLENVNSTSRWVWHERVTSSRHVLQPVEASKGIFQI